MNKKLTANKAVAWGVVFLLCFFTTELSLAQVPAGGLSLPQVAASLDSPKEIARYMWRNFIYQKDQRQFGKLDYWQSPEELLTSGKGDCEDFALFALAILRAKGIRAFILNIYGRNSAHSVCVFRHGDYYHVIDGTKVYRHKVKSLEQLAKKISPFWTKGMIILPFMDKTPRPMKIFYRERKHPRFIA